MNFRSDNTASAAAEIMAALTSVNDGPAVGYGEDPWSRKLDEALGALFEREVRVFTVASGTAANSIALASVTPPWGSIICHREAHIECDECGAPEFFSGGAKLVLVDGEAAKLTCDALREGIARNARGIHSVKPSAVSISQTTERGAIYKPGEVAALGAIAKDAGLALHMDGARFANAVAALGCKPADVTWRAGVDLLSFGATKNGALLAESIVCFDLDLAEEIARRRKRSGHLICKGRYPAAQFLAYLNDGLWLKLAGRANALAARLGEAAAPLLSAPVESNQVFIRPGADKLATLRAAGADFYDWGEDEARLVVSWNQPEADIDALSKLLKAL
ncbi:MAG: beta-eliminating lyase-related protein [Hyphomonadaceae bacterium JAD_PAG50586_4]|nr:MAG: beta-eliminating lyase-related protein [Hyphomonadaceae bacterium JAD_PAG50586_4]